MSDLRYGGVDSTQQQLQVILTNVERDAHLSIATTGTDSAIMWSRFEDVDAADVVTLYCTVQKVIGGDSSSSVCVGDVIRLCVGDGLFVGTHRQKPDRSYELCVTTEQETQSSEYKRGGNTHEWQIIVADGKDAAAADKGKEGSKIISCGESTFMLRSVDGRSWVKAPKVSDGNDDAFSSYSAHCQMGASPSTCLTLRFDMSPSSPAKSEVYQEEETAAAAQDCYTTPTPHSVEMVAPAVTNDEMKEVGTAPLTYGAAVVVEDVRTRLQLGKLGKLDKLDDSGGATAVIWTTPSSTPMLTVIVMPPGASPKTLGDEVCVGDLFRIYHPATTSWMGSPRSNAGGICSWWRGDTLVNTNKTHNWTLLSSLVDGDGGGKEGDERCVVSINDDTAAYRLVYSGNGCSVESPPTILNESTPLVCCTTDRVQMQTTIRMRTGDSARQEEERRRCNEEEEKSRQEAEEEDEEEGKKEEEEKKDEEKRQCEEAANVAIQAAAAHSLYDIDEKAEEEEDKATEDDDDDDDDDVMVTRAVDLTSQMLLEEEHADKSCVAHHNRRRRSSDGDDNDDEECNDACDSDSGDDSSSDYGGDDCSQPLRYGDLVLLCNPRCHPDTAAYESDSESGRDSKHHHHHKNRSCCESSSDSLVYAGQDDASQLTWVTTRCNTTSVTTELKYLRILPGIGEPDPDPTCPDFVRGGDVISLYCETTDTYLYSTGVEGAPAEFKTLPIIAATRSIGDTSTARGGIVADPLTNWTILAESTGRPIKPDSDFYLENCNLILGYHPNQQQKHSGYMAAPCPLADTSQTTSESCDMSILNFCKVCMPDPGTGGTPTPTPTPVPTLPGDCILEYDSALYLKDQAGNRLALVGFNIGWVPPGHFQYDSLPLSVVGPTTNMAVTGSIPLGSMASFFYPPTGLYMARGAGFFNANKVIFQSTPFDWTLRPQTATEAGTDLTVDSIFFVDTASIAGTTYTLGNVGDNVAVTTTNETFFSPMCAQCAPEFSTPEPFEQTEGPTPSPTPSPTPTPTITEPPMTLPGPGDECLTGEVCYCDAVYLEDQLTRLVLGFGFSGLEWLPADGQKLAMVILPGSSHGNPHHHSTTTFDGKVRVGDRVRLFYPPSEKYMFAGNETGEPVFFGADECDASDVQICSGLQAECTAINTCGGLTLKINCLTLGGNSDDAVILTNNPTDFSVIRLVKTTPFADFVCPAHCCPPPKCKLPPPCGCSPPPCCSCPAPTCGCPVATYGCPRSKCSCDKKDHATRACTLSTAKGDTVSRSCSLCCPPPLPVVYCPSPQPPVVCCPAPVCPVPLPPCPPAPPCLAPPVVVCCDPCSSDYSDSTDCDDSSSSSSSCRSSAASSSHHRVRRRRKKPSPACKFKEKSEEDCGKEKQGTDEENRAVSGGEAGGGQLGFLKRFKREFNMYRRKHTKNKSSTVLLVFVVVVSILVLILLFVLLFGWMGRRRTTA